MDTGLNGHPTTTATPRAAQVKLYPPHEIRVAMGYSPWHKTLDIDRLLKVRPAAKHGTLALYDQDAMDKAKAFVRPPQRLPPALSRKTKKKEEPKKERVLDHNHIRLMGAVNALHSQYTLLMVSVDRMERTLAALAAAWDVELPKGGK